MESKEEIDQGWFKVKKNYYPQTKTNQIGWTQRRLIWGGMTDFWNRDPSTGKFYFQKVLIYNSASQEILQKIKQKIQRTEPAIDFFFFLEGSFIWRAQKVRA